MTERIHNFTGNLIAFYRPIKKSYYFLTWNNIAQIWGAYDTEHANISLHKTTGHARNGHVDINIRLGRTRTRVSVNADRHFLKTGNICIPILKSSTTIKGIQKLKQYTVNVEHDAATYLINNQLWTVPAAAPAATASASSTSVNNAHAHALQQINKSKIPRRIAWLIAEDSSKRSELCPITQDEISPLTCSVTSCFHVFNTEAITAWAARQTSTSLPCPVCREPCTTIAAYQET
jgi:hypothetical protein